MDRYQEVDAYVPVEGEIGFSNLVQYVLEAESPEAAKAGVRNSAIQGCLTRTPDGAVQYSPAVRLRDLESIPSPYLLGLMDKFFDGRLVPIIQTNRGCPFTCSFCVDGSALVSKVNYFPLERVRQELEYISPRVPSTTRGMEISDLNFGMYKRDAEICDVIREMQERYDWPKYITAPTGKNRKERIIESVSRLQGTLRLAMSVQSTDAGVLTNIKRDNISVDAMTALAPKIREAGLRTHAEMILSLPGDTYQTHLQTVRDLTSANIDLIKGYTLMLLAGSELASPAEREKWGFITKFRPLTMDFAELSNGRRVIETEEIVVGSNTLSTDEYVDLRVLAFVLWVMTRGVAYDALLKFLKGHEVDVVELYLAIKEAGDAPESVTQVLHAFRQATIDELWDSAEEIEEHYQDDVAYQKLLNGEEGVNLLNYFGGLVTTEYMDDWTDYTITVANTLLRQQGVSDNVLWQFSNIANYCRGITSNIVKQGFSDRTIEFEFYFDIERWLKDETGKTLDHFVLNAPQRISFEISDEQVKLREDLFLTYGDGVVGRGQAIKQVPPHLLWRQPVVRQEASSRAIGR